MNPRRLPSDPTTSSAPRPRTRRGETTATLLMGLFIGTMIVTAFVAFWVRSTHLEVNTEDLTKKESTGLNVLNRIKGDVGESASVAYAGDSELVLDQVDDQGDITRVLYAMDDQGRIYRMTREDAPDTYNPAATSEWGPEKNREYLASDVRNTVSATPKPIPLFTYIGAGGTTVDTGASGFADVKDLAGINRIDIAFAARAGEGSKGFVELRTSASLNVGPGGAVDPLLPACPLPYFVKADPYAVIRWDVTGQTTSYRVLRDGAQVATKDLSDTVAEGVYEYTDTTVVGKSSAAFQVLAVGPGGTSTSCPTIIWYPRIATPAATTTLQAAATESPAWVGSGYTTPTVQISWPAVPRAYSYEVYRRPILNKSPWTVMGSYSRVGGAIPSTTTSFTDNLGTSGWDKAYQYQVVAHGPMPEPSLPTAGMKVLAHTKAPTSASAAPVNYNQNRITWTTDPGETATGIAVYRRDVTGCFPAYSTWTKVAGPFPLTQNTWTDTSAPLSTRFEYAVGAYNTGPRGGTSNLQYASPLSGSGQALQFPADPTTTATGSFTTPSPSRAALTTGFVVSNVGVSNVAWSSPCASTTSTYRLDLYGNSRSTAYAKLDMGAQTSYKDPGWFDSATEHNYKAVAYNATGASPNNATTNGLVAAYQYSNRPSNGSITPFRSTYDEYNGYTDDNVRPAGILGSCYSTVVNVDDSHWEAGWDTRIKTPAHWQGGNVTVQHSGHPNRTVDGHAPTAGPHSWTYWDPKKTWVPDEYEQWWNPQKTWVPDSDGDLKDYRWYCTRYQGGYTVSWNEAADTGDSGNPFCNAGRGGCYASVYWTDTGSPSQASATGAGPYSRTFYWYTGLIYGHDYSYNVSQPEGVISCNVAGCASSVKATVCQVNCDPTPPTTGAPVAPTFSVVGSDTNNDTIADRDGTNTVRWNAVPNATGYRIYRYDTYANGTINTGTRTQIYIGSGSSCNEGGYTQCYYDAAMNNGNGTTKGTENYYKIVSFNGVGNGESTTVLPAYQVPKASALKIDVKPTLDNRDVTLSWTAEADGGMPANGKFCGVTPARGGCTYKLEGYDNINNVVDKRWNNLGNVTTATVVQPPGKDYTYTLYVCNLGGCVASAKSSVVSTYPDPFSIVRQNVAREETRGNKWYVNSVQLNPREFEMGDIFWDNSKGAVKYHYGFKEKSDDPFNRSFPGDFDGTFATAFNNGDNQNTTVRGEFQRRWTPQARYDYTVWAVAENGLRRQVSSTIFSAPPKILFGEVARFCSPTYNDRGFKTGYRFHLQGSSSDVEGPNATGVNRDITPDRIRWTWWAGLIDSDSFDEGGGASGAAGVRKLEETKALSTHNPTNWANTWDKNTSYHDQEYTSGGWAGGNTVQGVVLGGANEDFRVVPWQYRGWAAFGPYSWVNENLAANAADFGQYETGGNTYHLGTNGTKASCNNGAGTNWKWRGQSEGMGRWANTSESDQGYFHVPLDAPSKFGFGVTR